MLINEIDFAKALPLSSSFSYDRIEADIRRAEMKYIKPILGKDLYSILDGAYTAETTTTEHDNLLAFVHPALAHLAFSMFVPKGNVVVSDTGIKAMHSETDKPAFEWQVAALEKSMLKNGHDAIDELIEYLESVANTDFPDWLTSEGCTLVRSNVINTAVRFSDFIPMMKGSRWLFVFLRPIMSRLEKQLIISVTCKELYDEIKDQIKNDNLSANNLLLIENIEGAVAHSTWSSALHELSMTLDDDGISMVNNTFSGTVKGKQPVEANRISALRDQHTTISGEYLDQLRKQLYASPDDYPLFKDSACYIEDSTGSRGIENDDDSGLFAIGL